MNAHSTVRTIARRIFEAESPEQEIRRFPAQSLYLAIKYNGLHSSADLIELASLEQCRLFLDFDCWRRDAFNEENFWEWLELADEGTELTLLRKLLSFVDLKLVVLLIVRHVDFFTMEEPSETPLDVGYFTPDNGYTWLNIQIDDGRKHFLMGRFLAFIFETSPELFYQLLGVPGIQTESMLEEAAYGERCKRLIEQGIPDEDLANQLHSALEERELLGLLAKANRADVVEPVPVIEPLVYDSSGPHPLSDLIAVISRERIEWELTLLMNSAIIFWQVQHFEGEEVLKLTRKVRGAINIGLESAHALTHASLEEIYGGLGLGGLYRAGLGLLFQFRRAARSVPDDLENQIRHAILLGLRMPFPEIPEFYRADGDFISEGGKLNAGYRPIEQFNEMESLTQYCQISLKGESR